MIDRKLTSRIHYFLDKYPVVTVTGPRQSGKSTLLKNTFSDYTYLSLEDPDVLLLAQEDPRLFLKQYPAKVIIDEAQRFPDLFSWLQTHVDAVGKTGMYILSGSHNFLLMERISQSLAGRTAVLKLLPFSLKELTNARINPDEPDEAIFNGFYPRLHDKNLKPAEFYPFYIQTYVERDVRQLVNISDTSKFIKFVKLCAGRIGQLLNLSSLGTECGISQPTAQSWISVLESSYIVYLLKPFHQNFNKRLVKTPKLYFHDVGLACSLLGISQKEQIFSHYQRGALFENLIISEYLKMQYNQAKEPALYFWRDNTGNETDLIVEQNGRVYVWEIKSGNTYHSDHFKGLRFWEKATGKFPDGGVIYGGEKDLSTKHGQLLSWKNWCND